MSNKRELLKLLPLVRQQVAREISANHSSGGLFARGTAGEGFAGGYMAALDRGRTLARVSRRPARILACRPRRSQGFSAMTRSSDLVMVEREVLEAAKRRCQHYLARLEFRPTGRDPKNTGFNFAAVPEWALRQELARIELALQSVEGGVQVAAKQESCPEGAPHTETAIVTALRECQRVLAMMIDPASIKSTSVIHAFTAATAAEAKARAALSGVTKSAPGFKASHNSGERDPVVMPDCPGAEMNEP